MNTDIKPFEITENVVKTLSRSNFLLKYFPYTSYLALKYGAALFSETTPLNYKYRYVWAVSGAGRKSYRFVKNFKYAAQTLIDYFNDHIRAHKTGMPTVWLEQDLSPEPILGFGLIPVTPEWPVCFANFAGADETMRLIALAESEGITEDVCSASKASQGAAISGQLPKPVAMITSSTPCDSMRSSYQVHGNREAVPHFCLDIPYGREEEDFEFLAENIAHMIAFLEEKLSIKMDYKRLKAVLDMECEINQYLSEISEMNRAKPCPASNLEMIISWATNNCAVGNPNFLKFVKGIYEEAKDNLEKGKSAGPNPEKIRVIWHDVPVAFMFLINWLERKYGAYIVADMIGHKRNVPIDTTDEKSMHRSLANIYMNVSMARHFHGDMTLFFKELDELVINYEPHCLIFTLHRGCKQTWAIRNIIKKKGEEYNLPILMIDADMYDSRYKKENEIKNQIDEFFISSGLA